MRYVSFVALLLAAAAAHAQEPPAMQCWAVDPLIKVFRDAKPGGGPDAVADVARGEYASLQVVVRSDSAIAGLRAEATPLTLEGGDATLAPRAPRFVGYVNVDRPTQTPSQDQLRKPPADFPDPLLELESVDAKAGEAQPVWVTVHVPEDTKPGLYRGTLRVRGTVDGAEASAEFPLAVRVHDVVMKRPRLWVTEWYGVNTNHLAINPEPESDEWYALLRRYARNMAEHYHNVALISPLSLATFGVDADGQLTIDFARFDKWVELFKEEGVIGRIEGGHIGGRKGGWESDFLVSLWNVEDGKAVSTTAEPSSPEADAFYAQFFPALVTHLREKKWLDIYTQHLADEPIESNVDTYRAMAALARTHGPELKIIEACHTKELAGAMDVWVPQLNYLHTDFEHYQARQEAGEEVWFYTCVFPQGEYANRFIEQPLIKTRLLHWINFRYGITGYLHWGYNQWTGDSPYTHTTRPHGGPPYLPAGDPWIVYPGTDGPWDSIRFEAMRDGLADYELLCMLSEKDAAKAQAMAETFIPAFDAYNTNVAVLRQHREALLKALSE